MRPSVLHVSEAYGGGIVTALHSFAANTPEVDHHLLIATRKSDAIAKDLSHFRSVSPMRRSLPGAIFDIRRKVAEIKPRFVHLHSSYAGVYGRIAGLDKGSVIYSPHGFPFEREASGKLLCAIYRGIEGVLAHRYGHFAGVSLHEVALASRMNPRSISMFIPNSTDVAERPLLAEPPERAPIKAVLVGRVNAQKDPRFLLQVLERLPADVRRRFRFTWVGDGDKTLVAALRAASVEVTGWIDHAGAARHLSGADLYLHFARWEGFPMTVIEAAAMGKPALLRSINAFEGYGFPDEALARDAEAAAQRLLRLSTLDADAWRPHYALADMVREVSAPERQRAALLNLYLQPETVPATGEVPAPALARAFARRRLTSGVS